VGEEYDCAVEKDKQASFSQRRVPAFTQYQGIVKRNMTEQLQIYTDIDTS
jgi:hypothetical protein